MADAGLKTFTISDFRLQSGIVMPEVTISYRTLGTLAADRGNAVLVPRERAEGNVARLLATLSKDPNWNGGDYYDVGGVAETMTQIRMATLKTYGIEDRLKATMSDPVEIEAAIRDEAGRWAKSFDA